MASWRHEQKYQMVVLGSEQVGKTAWARQFVSDSFPDTYQTTIGIAYLMTMLRKNDGSDVRVQLWDTGGRERFASLRVPYIRNSQIIVLVFDVTQPESLSDLEPFITQAKEFACSDARLLLLGNKADLAEQRQISEDDAKDFALKHNCKYIETSAKTSLGMQAVKQFIREAPVPPSTANVKPEPNYSAYPDLSAEINAFQQKWPNNSSIQQIGRLLKSELIRRVIDPRDYHRQLTRQQDILQQLRTLQWTSQSLLNSALNMIFTIFAKLGVYNASVLESNQRLHGNRYRFYAFGEKQTAEVMITKTITRTISRPGV